MLPRHMSLEWPNCMRLLEKFVLYSNHRYLQAESYMSDMKFDINQHYHTLVIRLRLLHMIIGINFQLEVCLRITLAKNRPVFATLMILGV